MKLFKDYCEDITEQEYRESNRLSYSFLKDLDDIGPRAIVEPKKPITGKGLTLGTVVDRLCENSDYDANDDFTLTDIDLDLSGTTHTDTLLRHIKDNNLEVNEEYDFTEIFKELGFKRAPKLDDEFWVKADLINSEKPLLPQREYELAMTMSETLKYHEFTKDIFDPALDIEVINQAIIFFNWGGSGCRGMLDKVLINHDEKVIYPYDIKTGSSANFLDNFWNFKYYLQGSMYTAAIQSIVQTKEEFKDYKVAPFEFIYVSRVNPNIPFRFRMPEKFIELGMTGWDSQSGKHFKGITELIDDYKWYQLNNEFNLRREIVENNGLVEINTPLTR